MHSLPTTDIVLRLLTALACGAAIGLNRDLHHKAAGFRTFGLVSLGSAAVTLLMLQIPGTGVDAVSRVIQGVLTGVGFLGAGVILHREQPHKVSGLTTAAAIWLSLAFALLLLIAGGPIERMLGRLFGSDRSDKNEPKQ